MAAEEARRAEEARLAAEEAAEATNLAEEIRNLPQALWEHIKASPPAGRKDDRFLISVAGAFKASILEHANTFRM